MGEATHSTARTHAQSNENKRAHIRKCGPVDGDEAGDGEGEIRRGRVSFVGAPKPSHGHSARMSPPWRAMPHRIARRHSLGPHHIPRPSFIFFVSPAVPSGRPACLHAPRPGRSGVEGVLQALISHQPERARARGTLQGRGGGQRGAGLGPIEK